MVAHELLNYPTDMHGKPLEVSIIIAMFRQFPYCNFVSLISKKETPLNLGHGKYACFRRYCAPLKLKRILVTLIMKYRLKLPSC
jgi:hypothetical protein